jgi:hypothetical protein
MHKNTVKIMKRFPVLVLSLIILASFPVRAAEKAMPTVSDMDQHFAQCLNNTDCKTQEQLQLVMDISAGMTRSLQSLFNACLAMNYKNCIVPNMDEITQWRHLHQQAGDMMQAMTSQYVAAKPRSPMGGQSQKTAWQLDQLQPAAGTPDPYINPDQKQELRQKAEWWKGWGPPDQSNPYHKW